MVGGFQRAIEVVVYDSLGRVATNFLYAAGASVRARRMFPVYDANGRLYQTLRPEGMTTMRIQSGRRGDEHRVAGRRDWL